jgi:hypothetical protein
LEAAVDAEEDIDDDLNDDQVSDEGTGSEEDDVLGSQKDVVQHLPRKSVAKVGPRMLVKRTEIEKLL